VGRADYNEIAEVYDQARKADKPHLEWWYTRLAEAGGLGPGKRLIDLGCGTGRFTIPLVERTGCEAVGLDGSPEMLARAREKDSTGRITWVLGDVENLDVEAAGFDCALMSLMMHHLQDHLGMFRRVLGLLRPGGVFLVRQGTLEQILNDAMHRFFPETIGVDLARTPMRLQIEQWLRQAHFAEVEVELIKQKSAESSEQVLDELRLRVHSALRLIGDDAFYAGLRRAEEHVLAHPDDDSLTRDLFTLFVARKEG
jgi:ubiquinone/menaquinone biosynthesis C-methylase UbiE